MALTVLITGAGCGGIGRQLVYRFVSLGDTVLALDLSEEKLDLVVAESAGMTGDVHKVAADGLAGRQGYYRGSFAVDCGLLAGNRIMAAELTLEDF